MTAKKNSFKDDCLFDLQLSEMKAVYFLGRCVQLSETDSWMETVIGKRIIVD
jgi:hypothetical protein